MTEPRSGAGRLTVAAMTHVGAVRRNNQDSLVAGAEVIAGADTPAPLAITLGLDRPQVVAVADGLGGHAAGEVASGHVAHRLAGDAPLLTGPHAVAKLLSTLDDELYELAAADAQRTGMGTTVAGLVVSQTGVIWFNVGDSRIYRQEPGGRLTQVSVDDSPRPPHLPPDAPTPPTAVVTQALGGFIPRATIHPHIGTVPPAPARWLLCSDGLSDLVPTVHLERILDAHPDDTEAIRALWAAAMAAGGRDNITVLVARYVPPGTSPTPDDRPA